MNVLMIEDDLDLGRGLVVTLGLAIVRAAAARLGGTVYITDGLDERGCTFLVQFLPAPDPQEMPASQDAPANATAGSPI